MRGHLPSIQAGAGQPIQKKTESGIRTIQHNLQEQLTRKPFIEHKLSSTTQLLEKIRLKLPLLGISSYNITHINRLDHVYGDKR